MPSNITHPQNPAPGPRTGHPMIPARGKRWDAHDALEGAGVLYVGLQVASPWAPRNSSEVGRRGVGARRVLAASAPLDGWELGSTHVVHHANDGFWSGTWEIEGIVTWPGGQVTGSVPYDRLTLWLLQDAALPAVADARATANSVTARNAEMRAKDRAAEYAEGTGVGDFVIYRSSEGREYPALVTITPASFDTSISSDIPEYISLDSRSVIVFRPSGSSYARHNVRRQTPDAASGARAWRPRG